MGIFDFVKKEKKKESSSKPKLKKEAFEVGANGLIFNAQIQILGSPKEYAKKVANDYLESIEKASDEKLGKKYHVIRKEVSSPKKYKPGENEQDLKHPSIELYSVFVDLDIGVKDKTRMFDFCFDFMPFSIEVIEPMRVGFDASDLTEYATNILATLHKIDEALKRSNAEKANLSRSMVRMLRNNIILSLKEKKRDLKEISKSVGIDQDQLKQFVDSMLADKEIKLEKGKYSVKK